jgi:hypothetical protein
LKVAPSPKQPSAADIELHRITHWPYRSWCEECVKGRGLGEQRGTHVGRDHEIPIVGLDYFYMTEKGLEHRSDLAYANDAEVKAARECGDIVLCIVIRCYASKNIFCHEVPCKGDDEDRFVVNLAVEDIGWLGHTRVILKSDQERSLVALVTRALEVLKFKVDKLESISVEHSQKYDSQASGGTEIGVRAVRGLFRTMRLCIEKRIGRGLPVKHPVSSWLLEHVSLLLNACVRGEDGLTPWARVRGRAFGQRLIGFGERVLWKLPTKGPQHDKDGNMSARWAGGIFVGYNRKSNSYKFITDDGNVDESRALQRKPILERWDVDRLADVKVTPWSTRVTEAAVRVDMGAEVDGHPPTCSRRCARGSQSENHYETTPGFRVHRVVQAVHAHPSVQRAQGWNSTQRDVPQTDHGRDVSHDAWTSKTWRRGSQNQPCHC